MICVWSFIFERKEDRSVRLFKSVDEKLAEIGFCKNIENEHVVYYERYDAKYKYVHSVDILHKSSGENIIQSYDSTCGVSAAVGLTGYEMKLFVKKMKQMGWYSGKDVTMRDIERGDKTEPV